MSANSKIEWCDHTQNFWIGCNAISPGCTNCYAKDWATRYGRDFATRTRTKTWRDPVNWNANHEAFFVAHGRRQRVFCSSLSDVFDNAVDPQWRVEMMQVIADTPNLDWLLLTKRIGNAHSMLDDALSELSAGLTKWSDVPWPNVWIGATIVNQEEADRDIPKLLAVPAAKRFLSMEPLLGLVDIREWLHDSTCPSAGMCICCEPREVHVDWVIAGGESGPNARAMLPHWAENLRDQCEDAGVPFLFKQWGGWAPDGSFAMRRVGKKAAGRLLDGRTWDGVPV